MRKINFQTIDQSLNDIKIYQFLNKILRRLKRNFSVFKVEF